MSQVPPTAEEVGHCDTVEVQEIGDTNVVVFRQGMPLPSSYASYATRTFSLSLVFHNN